MSGGGGGGGGDWRPEPDPIKPTKPFGGGGAGGGGGGANPCDIIEQTNLNSVNAAALASLAVGSILDVVYQSGPPAQLLAQSAGTTIGSITSPNMPQIIHCITQGYTYEAEILVIRGGVCQVEVRRT